MCVWGGEREREIEKAEERERLRERRVGKMKK
jgi:hypothetical protein